MATHHKRLEKTFGDLRAKGKKTLVAYLCVGDPSLEESIDLARTCLEAGADILELGVPFSDPTADGPAIARAGQRALSRGGGFGPTLNVAKAIREHSSAPIVLFGYYNPLFVRGEARAAKEASEAGVDALLVVDLPVEEAGGLRDAGNAVGISVVPLLAPTSAEGRVRALLDAKARWPIDFVYYVSVTGVTGTTAARADEAGASAAKLREALGVPTVVGFGIDSADKARAAAVGTDGVVVGTAIVRAIEDGKDAAARKEAVRRLVAELRAGLDR